MIVGIDLGTTNSAIAYMDENEIPQIITSRDGDRITPSVVLFENDTPIVGSVAKSNSVADPLNSVQFVKRQMGNPSYKFINESGESFTPEEVSAIILRRLKQDAEGFLGEQVDKAVITVPAYFDDSQRKATQDAGQIAGLHVLKIINEPTAAALAYGYSKNNTSQNIMVYDLGGGTFDVTIMNINNGEVVIKATGGDRNLGGFNFDNCIIEHIQNQFMEQFSVDIYDDISALQELREKSEACKKTLSTREKALVNVSCEGKTLKSEITRELFNEKIAPLINRTIFIMKTVLQDANYEWSDIDKILLVGGSTRIKLVSEMIEKESGKKPSQEVNPDEVVAIGAAIQASLVNSDTDTDQTEDSPKMTKITDVNSHSLGILAMDQFTNKMKNCIILKRNTPIPAEESQVFCTVSDKQKYIEIEVTEGEDEDVEYVRVIGKAQVTLPERPNGSPVKIVIAYDENSIVHVSAIDEMTSKYLGEMNIERKSNLTKDDVISKTNKISNLTIE
jgi:molecular chaperone DnaK